MLGPVEAWNDGRRLELGPPRQRAVLAALAVDAGRPVGLATLVDRVWDEAPPVEVRPALYAYVSRLRRVLRQASQAGEPPVELARQPGGYVLHIDPNQVDVHRFRRLVAAARGPDCADAARVELLSQALGLWRGALLADLPGEWAARQRDSWALQRLDAVVAWAEAQLRLGRAEQVIGPARDWLADYPLAEPLVGVLLKALVAAGRAAEALDCYATARARLVQELGAEPGAQLQALHQAILRGELEPSTAVRRPVASAGVARLVPAQLPADVADFTGRTVELAELERLLPAPASGTDQPAGAGEQPTAVVVSAIAGTAGVGKTALAVHWAHLVRDRFPDGQLYVDLHGFAPGPPTRPIAALAQLLGGLGVDADGIPLQVDQAAALYRSLLADRRVLVVVDNACDADQVRPLLPGSPGCLVVVTSRDRLAGLVAIDGARRLELDLLPPADAVGLLGRLIGDRVEREPDAAVLLAERCVRLPLALRVAAELAARRPTTPLAELAAELADRQRRLELLDVGGDPRAAVTSVLSWSVQQLPPAAARLFRLLGLAPGPDVDASAATALAGGSVQHTGRLLDTLARAHLVQPVGLGRYDMHDLLRAYAACLAAAEDTQDRRAALTRLFDYQLATAAAAMDTLEPAERHRRPRVPTPATPIPAVADPAAARAWLDAERANLVAACVHSAGHGWTGHTIRLAATLFRYLDTGGHYLDALTIHTHARQAASRAGDQAGQAHALANLGGTFLWRGELRQAAEHFQQALALFRRLGDRAGQARALNNLGLVNWRQGELRQAADHTQEALTLYRLGMSTLSGPTSLARSGSTPRSCASNPLSAQLPFVADRGGPNVESVVARRLPSWPSGWPAAGRTGCRSR